MAFKHVTYKLIAVNADLTKEQVDELKQLALLHNMDKVFLNSFIGII